MRKWIERLVYRKWFYGFVAAALWLDTWTDLEDVLDGPRPRELLSLVLSAAAAVLVTLVFVDLHFRWTPQRNVEADADRSHRRR